MQLNIHAKDLTLTDQQKSYIESKINKLCNFSARINDESTEIKVEILESGRHSYQPDFEVQVTMFIPNAIIRAEDTGKLIEEAIDKVEEKLKKQIDRYKAKSHRRDNAGKWIPIEENVRIEEEEESEFEIPKILRRKRVSKFIPMHEEEAIEQMELLGHNFFLFMNQDTNRVSVVYKRSDGFYGIIEPKTEEDFEYMEE